MWRVLCSVARESNVVSSRSLSTSNVTDHTSQILHSDRLRHIDVHPSIFRARSRFRARDAGESSNVDSPQVKAAFVVANFRSRFKTVHDLDIDVSGGDEHWEKQGPTGMFMSISTRKYREGAALYFSRASSPLTAQSASSLSLPISAMRS